MNWVNCSRLWSPVVFVLLLVVCSCGQGAQLTSMTITPVGETIGANPPPGPNITIHYTALGSFSHGHGTEDITNRVVWKSSAPEVIDFVSQGVAEPTGRGCGTNLTITATASPDLHSPPSGKVIVGITTVNVTLAHCG